MIRRRVAKGVGLLVLVRLVIFAFELRGGLRKLAERPDP
jgi:hypothetical protein